MAEQWISAADALGIAGDAVALCTRLHAGLIEARAMVFRVDDSAIEDTRVPPYFWWAKGHEALDQDWRAGDFGTWLNRQQRLDAFGVTFALSGVQEMVAIERRPEIARRLSVAGNPAWVSAREARRICYSDYGHNPLAAGSAIIEQAKVGFIVARAVLAEARLPAQLDQPHWQEREWDIPTRFWNSLDILPGDHNWVQGTFSGESMGQGGVSQLTVIGVHFLRDSLSALGSANDAPPTSDGRAKGRRPTYDWEAATAAIWGQILRGELIPDNQAQIERAFLQYLAKGDKEPSESSVRPYANRIWVEFSK